MDHATPWGLNETHHVVLFVKKNPTPRTHARSLFIRQEPMNAVVQPIKLTTVTFNRHSPLRSPMCHVVLDLNDALLPNTKRNGLLGRDLL